MTLKGGGRGGRNCLCVCSTWVQLLLLVGIVSFLCNSLRTVVCFGAFIFLSLYFLSVCDLRIPITPLASLTFLQLNLSTIKNNQMLYICHEHIFNYFLVSTRCQPRQEWNSKQFQIQCSNAHQANRTLKRISN